MNMKNSTAINMLPSKRQKYRWRNLFKAGMFLAIVSVYAGARGLFHVFDAVGVNSAVDAVSAFDAFDAFGTFDDEEGLVGARRQLLATTQESCGVNGTAWKSDPEEEDLLCRALIKNKGRDALTYEQIRNGGFMLYIVGVFYMFVAIAIVCDDFFVPALEILAEKLQMSNDVAGATLMAAGGSAPELFTSFIGTFSDSPVGFGTIVGSAVFNVLFVIAMCAVFSKGILVLTWWPLFRDSTYYTISLLLLAYFFMNKKSDEYKCINELQTDCQTIEVWEAGIMFVMYIGYVGLMSVHTKVLAQIERCLGKRNAAKVVPDTRRPSIWEVKDLNKSNEEVEGIESIENLEDGSKNGSKDGEAEDPEDEEEGFEMEWPEGGWDQAKFIFILPITAPLYYSMYFIRPSRGEEARNQLKWGVAGFLISILWIGLFAFLMVWWTEIVGATFGIPIYVMGITFLAAGTSVPDLVSSVIVAKLGHGDMAVSSSIGSNIFDITVGLPLPWLTYLAVRTGKPIEVQGTDVAFSILTLVAMLASVITVTAWSGWKMTKKLGGAMLILYLVFLTADLLRFYV